VDVKGFQMNGRYIKIKKFVKEGSRYFSKPHIIIPHRFQHFKLTNNYFMLNIICKIIEFVLKLTSCYNIVFPNIFIKKSKYLWHVGIIKKNLIAHQNLYTIQHLENLLS
jgi:hypothetical protein